MPYRVTHEHATVSVREFAMTNAARGGYELRTEQQLIYAETAAGEDSGAFDLFWPCQPCGVRGIILIRARPPHGIDFHRVQRYSPSYPASDKRENRSEREKH